MKYELLFPLIKALLYSSESSYKTAIATGAIAFIESFLIE
jgi:hypothetical protein